MLVAVDTNFLLALADWDDDAWDAVETLRRKAKHLLLIASPTVVGELAFFTRFSLTTPLGRNSRKAVAGFARDWQIRAEPLDSVQTSIVEQISLRLRRKQVVPEAEKHDSLILAEAAILNCVLLVTSDAELRGVDFARLAFELRNFDVNAPVIATPKEIVQKFFR